MIKLKRGAVIKIVDSEEKAKSLEMLGFERVEESQSKDIAKPVIEKRTPKMGEKVADAK